MQNVQGQGRDSRALTRVSAATTVLEYKKKHDKVAGFAQMLREVLDNLLGSVKIR